MWTWLFKIDPNTVLGAATVLVSLATWLYHKARGDKTASLADQMSGLGKQVIHLLLTDPSINSTSNLDQLKTVANDLLWTLATKIGIPRNAITEGIAATLIEHIVGDVLTQIRKLDDQAAKDAANLAAIEQKARSTLVMLQGMRPDLPFAGNVDIQPDGTIKNLPPEVPTVKTTATTTVK